MIGENQEQFTDGAAGKTPSKAGVRLREKIDIAGAVHALWRHPLMALAAIFSLASTIYWLFIASDLYVSEAQVIVQKTDLSPSSAPDIGSLLLGGSSAARGDQLVMREYLLSRDMAAKLDDKLDLRGHFSRWTVDPFSRLSFANSSNDVYGYYRQRVTIEFDEYAGVLVVRSQAFEPEMARNMTAMLIADGAGFMNKAANDLAAEQVSFLRGEVSELEERARDARKALVAYQNRNEVASPEAQASSITQIIAQLETRRSELQVQLATQSAFLVDDHPVIVELRRQIAAIDRQIEQQNARLAGPRGGSLASKMEQFALLEADAKFAEELYRTALAALEKGQVESTRTIKTLSVIQKPNLPDEAELPQRWRKAIIYAAFAFLIAGVLQMLVMIIRDHRD